MPVFDRGAEAAEEASKSGRTFSGRVPFLVVKEDDKNPTVIRMVTEHTSWITADVHISVPTKPAPKGQDKWPKALSFVCQNNRMFRIRKEDGTLCEPPKWEDGYGHCWIHENLADQLDNYKRSRAQTASQVYALCVLRKLINSGEGFTITDMMEEWKDKDGKTWQVPAFRLITQKWTNFFGPIHATAYLPPKSVCTRDFMITREDSKTYNIVPADRTDDLHPGTKSWSRYTDAMEKMGIDLGRIVVDASSPEFYGRFLDPAVEVKPRKEEGAEDAARDEESSAPEGEEVSPEALEQYRREMMASANTGPPADGSPS